MRWITLRRVRSLILQSLNPNNHLFVSMFNTVFHNLFEFFNLRSKCSLLQGARCINFLAHCLTTINALLNGVYLGRL